MNINYYQTELSLKIELPIEVLDKLKNAAIKHFPKEFGGIFIGSYSDDNMIAFISDILIPEQFTNSPTTFQRKTDDLNEKLKELYELSQGKIIYIGEWHSHPNGSPNFSQSDFNAMKHIANDINVGANNPLMLILSLTLKNSKPVFYVFKNNKFYKYDEK